MHRFRIAVRHLLRLVPPSSVSPGQELCRAFLDGLSSEAATRGRETSSRNFQNAREDPNREELAAFLHKSSHVIEREVESALAESTDFGARLGELAAALHDLRPQDERSQALAESFWAVFSPEASGVVDGWEDRVRELRRKRTVEIDSLSPAPVRRPAREMLWSANALLTVPPKELQSKVHLDEKALRHLETADVGRQAYWYDHPVPIGVAPERNEILYGLRGLSRMLAFEKSRGTAEPDDRLHVVMSVSVTHPGLRKLARPYVESVLNEASDVDGLNVHIFTEEDTLRLIEAFLLPAARIFGVEEGDPELFTGVFGVDGPYGRHYNFLKAVSVLWRLVRDPIVNATFKIDLDQIFPEDRLVRELDRSAFELLTTPLWGATGRDSSGRPVELGMIAGALVNQADIHRGLFTPDVKLPDPPLPADRWVLPTSIPQALSTEAEMMARYDQADLDGVRRCLSRVHVTGGTTGIRVDALRRYRPFTLSCISRAEDQAYIMSVLHGPGPRFLRYAHLPGLIMRHDKASFAADAIVSAAAGKTIGDLERMILFSGYARALPWSWEETRSSLTPFTGCFIHRTPFTTALIAFALKALCNHGGLDIDEFLSMGARRLGSLLDRFERSPGWLKHTYQRERATWNVYYDVLDRVEGALRNGSSEARRLVARAESVLQETVLQR